MKQSPGSRPTATPAHSLFRALPAAQTEFLHFLRSAEHIGSFYPNKVSSAFRDYVRENPCRNLVEVRPCPTSKVVTEVLYKNNSYQPQPHSNEVLIARINADQMRTFVKYGIIKGKPISLADAHPAVRHEIISSLIEAFQRNIFRAKTVADLIRIKARGVVEEVQAVSSSKIYILTRHGEKILDTIDNLRKLIGQFLSGEQLALSTA